LLELKRLVERRNPHVEAKIGVARPGGHVYRYTYWFFRLASATLFWKQRFAVGESDLWSEVKKFTVKRGLEATLPARTPAAGLADPKTGEMSIT
jgi:hypothetical protein